LVLSGITNQSFGVGEGYVRGGGTVTLVIGDDLNLIIYPNTHTRVGGSEVDSYGWSFVSFVSHSLNCNLIYLCNLI
jgi:hypothetical protein